MNISEKKKIERNFFKKLRKKNSYLIEKNVEKNVKIYINSIMNKGIKNKYVGIYFPLKHEVDITSLRFEYFCALPKCEKNKRLVFCPWKGEKLTKDLEGIPAPKSPNVLSYESISMLFIPCLSVDKNLIRLGYGGGYFDRLRKDKNWKKIPCIGILTSNCVSESLLASEDWDVPLSGFITEKEIIV